MPDLKAAATADACCQPASSINEAVLPHAEEAFLYLEVNKEGTRKRKASNPTYEPPRKIRVLQDITIGNNPRCKRYIILVNMYSYCSAPCIYTIYSFISSNANITEFVIKLTKKREIARYNYSLTARKPTFEKKKLRRCRNSKENLL